MADRPIVVTGASGFVGRRLAEVLEAAGHPVEAWHWSREAPSTSARRRVDLTRDLPDCEVAPVAIVHAAALAHAQPSPELLPRLRELNVGGTRRLLDWASRHQVPRVLLLSSIKAQGSPPPGETGTEKSPQRPEGPYGEAKLEAERLLAAWAGAAEREGIALRLPLVYGPGVRGNLERLARATLRGWVPQVGPGTARRSLVALGNVASAVNALLSAASRPGFRKYLVTDEAPYSLAEMLSALAAASGRKVRHPRLPLFVARVMALAGDLGETVLRRPLPFSTPVLERLTGDAVFSSAALQRDYDWKPSGSFAEHASGLLASIETGDAEAPRTS